MERRGRRHQAADSGRYKVLFTLIRTHASDPSGDEIIKRAYGRDPILVVGINTETQSVTGVETRHLTCNGGTFRR